MDFSNARARLVSSFPGSPEDRGGWMQLANTVRELRDEDLEVDSDSDVDPSPGDDHEVKKKLIGST